ncbi:MAG TPA: glycosyltransferase [Opitutaceae bacterium]|nr:glycosyltransferase [Opitutaceae bacterium]
MRLAITIATHNRREELARTCAHLRELDPAPDELWICADGCTDDTVSWLRENLPAARVLVHAAAKHSIRSRDEMLRACDADIVVGLDDDSYPLDRDFVARVKARFAAWPVCAVLSFPQRTDEFPATLSQTDFGPCRRAGSYVNAASAIRRRTYLALGGWPLEFEHMGDEADFSLRCLAAGSDVIYDTSLVVRHHWSARMRSEISNHHRHARNEAWSILLRCPAPWWPLLLARRAAGQFFYGCRRGLRWVVAEPRWWLAAARGTPGIWRQRQPVSWHVYRRWLKLLRAPEPL